MVEGVEESEICSPGAHLSRTSLSEESTTAKAVLCSPGVVEMCYRTGGALLSAERIWPKFNS